MSTQSSDPFQPTWNSLQAHVTPQWFRRAKFGIYTHWGVYSVPARGPNATWYPFNMYRKGTEQYNHHVATYGDPSTFGYKDFIPMFTAEKFDADEWAEIFQRSGARFAGPVGEHHDGFCMWDTKHSPWNAKRMGPRRDVVGELEKAVRRQGLKFLVALHHAENWWFFPHWMKQYDTADPRYAGLYGEGHDLDRPADLEGPHGAAFFDQAKPSRAFLDTWQAKIHEVIDSYEPDMLWFDFGLAGIPEAYKQEFVAYYYNKEREWNRGVVVSYKKYDLAPGTGIIDLELGRMAGLTYHEWLTDTTVDDGEGWGYLRETAYKSVTTLVHYLVDNVSKNGYLLLNVGPKPDGTLPVEAKSILEGMGAWLRVNGEAIYDTGNWITHGEGPTKVTSSGSFNEKEVVQFTAEDIRFTVKDKVLYAICLGWPGRQVLIRSLKNIYPSEITSIRLLGVDGELTWSLGPEGLAVQLPASAPCQHAVALKILRARPF